MNETLCDMVEYIGMGLKPLRYLYFTNPFTKVNGNLSQTKGFKLPPASTNGLKFTKVNGNLSQTKGFKLPPTSTNGLKFTKVNGNLIQTKGFKLPSALADGLMSYFKSRL